MNQVPLVFPEFGAACVVKQVGRLVGLEKVLGFVAKGVAQVKGAMGQLVGKEFKVCSKVKNKPVITRQGHKTFSIASQVRNIQKEEVHGVIVCWALTLVLADNLVHIRGVLAKHGSSFHLEVFFIYLAYFYGMIVAHMPIDHRRRINLIKPLCDNRQISTC